MTALTLNGSAVAASTLAAAGKLFNATGGSSGNTSTKVGSGTLFKQIFAKGTTTNQTGVSSIPAPTDSNFNGWMWDVDTLAGQLLQAGTLTPTIHLLASTGTTVTPTVQWFKRTSGGVWSQLASVAGSSIALTTSSQALTFVAPSMSDTPFATGDRLCCWLWVNQTAGGATNSTISVVEATSASSAGVTSEAQTVTQGYIPIVTTTYSFTDALTASESVLSTDGAIPTDGLVATSDNEHYANLVLNGKPVRYYRLDESSGTNARDLGSQATNGTLNGGVTLGQAGALTGDTDAAELFNGTTGYINCGTYSTGLTTVSIEAWIKGASLDLNTNGMMIVEVSTVNTFWELFIENGILKLRGGGVTTVSVAPPSNNAWHHIVGTITGTIGTIYIDGAQAATGTVDAVPTTSGTLSIGCYDAGGGYFWNGSLDEVTVYPYALSPSQVFALYTLGVSGPWYGSPSVDVVLPIDALSADDSASTMIQVPVSGPTTTTYSFTDALSAADSLLALDTTLPVESLRGSDSLLQASTTVATESLTVSESVLGTGASIPIGSLSISDTALMAGTSLPTEALIVSDIALASDGNLSTEANSASAIFIGSGTGQMTESLVTSDMLLEADGYVPLDSLSASDSQLSLGAYVPLEGLTGVSSPLGWDVYLPADDALVASDSFSSTEVPAGAVTTTYSFEDDLSITDIFTGQKAYVPVDANTGSDAFTGQNTSLPTDGLSATDALLTQSSTGFTEAGSVLDAMLLAQGYVPFDALSANDAYATVRAYVPVDALTLLDSLTTQDGYSVLDTLSAASLQSALQSWPVDALVISESFTGVTTSNLTDRLSIADDLLIDDLDLWIELVPVSDSFIGKSVVPPAIERTVIVARGRDGLVVARSRDGRVIAYGRDGKVMARGRDGKVVAHGDDGLTVGRGR